MFVLHLVPDRVWSLHPLLYLVVDAHLVECFLDRSLELFKEHFTLLLCLLQFLVDRCKLIRVFKAETEILQFRLHLI